MRAARTSWVMLPGLTTVSGNSRDEGTAIASSPLSMQPAGSGSVVGVTPSRKQKQSMPTVTSSQAADMQNCVVVAHAPTLASDMSEGSRPSQLCTSIVLADCSAGIVLEAANVTRSSCVANSSPVVSSMMTEPCVMLEMTESTMLKDEPETSSWNTLVGDVLAVIEQRTNSAREAVQMRARPPTVPACVSRNVESVKVAELAPSTGMEPPYVAARAPKKTVRTTSTRAPLVETMSPPDVPASLCLNVLSWTNMAPAANIAPECNMARQYAMLQLVMLTKLL